MAEDAALAMREVSARIGEVAVAMSEGGSGGEPGEAFRALNLDIERLLELDPEAQFRRVTEALSGVSSQATRSALANAVLSDQYAELLPQLSRVAAGYDETAAHAYESGLVISESQAESSAQALEAWTGFTQLFRGAWNDVVTSNIDRITDLVTTVANSTPVQMALDAVDGFSRVFGLAITGLDDIIGKVGTPELKDSVLEAFKRMGAYNLLENVFGKGEADSLSERFAGQTSLMIESLTGDDGVLGAVNTLATAITVAFLGIEDPMTGLREGGIGGDFESAFRGLDDESSRVFGNLGTRIKTAEEQMEDGTGNWADNISEFFTGWGTQSRENKETNESDIDAVEGFIGSMTAAGIILTGGMFEVIGHGFRGLAAIMDFVSGAIVGDWDLMNVAIQVFSQEFVNAVLAGFESIIAASREVYVDVLGWIGTVLGVTNLVPGGSLIAGPALRFLAEKANDAIPDITFERRTYGDEAARAYRGATHRAALGLESGLGREVDEFRARRFLQENPDYVTDTLGHLLGAFSGQNSATSASLAEAQAAAAGDGLIRPGDYRPTFVNIYIDRDVTTEQGRQDEIVKVVKTAIDRGLFDTAGTPFGGIRPN